MAIKIIPRVRELFDIFNKYKWLVSLILIIIGLIALVFILGFPNHEAILLSIGVTFIASGITSFIFFPMEKEIVNKIHDDVTTTLSNHETNLRATAGSIHNDVTTALDLAKDCNKCRIKRIFYNRSDKNFEDELKKHFKGSKILMMGTTTVGDFFGQDPLHIGLFEKALEDGSEFEIILLDPFSDAARDNAVAEQKDHAFKNDIFYPKSKTFKNLKSATQYFCQKFKEVPEKLKVRYIKELPPMLFIKTDSFTFIELYAMRDVKSLPEGGVLQKLQREGYKAHGGYTPIFLLENDSEFAKFAKSHFEEIKTRGSRSLEEVAKPLRYLFSWDDIPGNDTGILKQFLEQKYGIDWLKTAKIEKIDGVRAIKLSFKDNFLSLNLNDDKTIVRLIIDDGRTDEFTSITENRKLNIYENWGKCK